MVSKTATYSWLGYGINLVILHIIGFGSLLFSMRSHPTLLGLGFLAYTLGLRHAFDADHIAAIDNTVRKLLQQKKNPMGVGFYFSLGHSTVVLLMALATAFTAQWVQTSLPQIKDAGGVISTSVSGLFLILIGVLNLIVLHDIYKVFSRMRHSLYDNNKLEELLHNRGFMARFLNPFFKFINKSWHVYPVGFLLGLGFDTASEVALLAISAGAAKNHVEITGIIALPVLFAAGMSLLDTADGIFMTTAYNWAFSTPLRKVYYNLTITSLSVVAALFIGIIELTQVMIGKFGLTGGIWQWIRDLDFGSLGYILVALFVFTWAISYSIWKFGHVEERWHS
ncbi:transition metal uptake transporter nickel/cobalt [Lucifera butyrica]|uniref:Nickel/cobalt efflux system n=1 Tax=Lucifera butyrica TaxID=1351585 RepID=A0A498R8C7_9FIRM|nr:HoxN/HupN/NixA family nickel/cobalt transporter [Lucifera butyrica]VBB08956.1 transition metal uptake transporter nickel/cobalt [Lucifera butyrica]